MLTDTVRYHPPEVIDRLLDWCEAHSLERIEAVTAIGLAYVYGLNEHQIAAARIAAADSSVTISYPDARTTGKIASAPDETLVLADPDWLCIACTLVAAASGGVGRLLFKPRTRLQLPVPVAEIRQLVAGAGAESTGVELSVATLVSTHTAAVVDAGAPLALHRIGYAPRTVARKMLARKCLIKPRLAA